MAFSLNSGALVLYHGKFAAVTAINKEKIEIRIEGGAAKSVRPKDVEFLHRGPVSVLPPKLLPEPDCAELLELMEGETLPFREFLLLAYSADTPEAAAFSFAQATMPFAASTWQTLAPAARAATVAAPV